MTSTTNIQLSTPAHGSNVNTWDADPVNNNSGILDNCFGSITTKGVGAVPITLSVTECQVNIIRLTGTLTANIAITVADIRKVWMFDNRARGLNSFFIRLQGPGGTGNFVGIPPGTSQIEWDGTNLDYINLGVVGEYVDYPADNIPLWVAASTIPPYLNCNGTTFNSAVYPLLFDLLGTTTLPDQTGRVRITLNQGSGRVTTAGSGINGDSRFSAGGVQNVVLATNQLPAHTHNNTLTDIGHFHNVPFFLNQTPFNLDTGGTFGSVNPVNSPNTTTNTSNITINNASAGNNDFHNNMPPGMVGGITLIRAA